MCDSETVKKHLTEHALKPKPKPKEDNTMKLLPNKLKKAVLEAGMMKKETHCMKVQTVKQVNLNRQKENKNI